MDEMRRWVAEQINAIPVQERVGFLAMGIVMFCFALGIGLYDVTDGFSAIVLALFMAFAATTFVYLDSKQYWSDDTIQQGKSISTEDATGKGIYIIQDIEVTGFYKIGRTNRPRHRLTNFGIKLPFEWKLIYWIETDDPVALESKLHTAFSHKRRRGEWFDLSDTDMIYIDGIMQAFTTNGHH